MGPHGPRRMGVWQSQRFNCSRYRSRTRTGPEFYVDVLGFELISDVEMGPDMRWVQVAPQGSTTSITLVTWFPTMPAGSAKGTVLETDDLENDIAVLKGRGVLIEGEIQEIRGGALWRSTTRMATGLSFRQPQPLVVEKERLCRPGYHEERYPTPECADWPGSIAPPTRW